MAEMVVIRPLVSLLKEKVSSYLVEQYKVMKGMEEQRDSLARKLPAILDVIEDAQKGASRPGVFKYEALRRDAKKKGHYNKLGMDVISLFPSRNPIVFRYRMSKKLSKVVRTMDVLVRQMNDFGFTQRQQVTPSMQWRQTDSIMIDSDKDIASRSRNEEKEKIIKILVEQEGNGGLMVLPIVGMGGLGKTTFVQLIYNEPQVKEHFSLQRWCCVSDDFDIGNIARNICHSQEKNHEKALQDLQKELSGQRYLIVLDDVWNRDADKWGKLLTCLKQGGRGSTILTTTRDAEVARVMTMGVPGAYNLEKLGNKYMKEIIQSRAFRVQKPNSDELDVIVDKIVDRCVGSPLAAKAFGSMLSTKTSMQEWKDILVKSNICNEKTEILPILKLSYDDLPPHMKQSFAFCALFPKDYPINVERLIQHWMAHDFIPAREEDNPDMVGKEIFNDLAWRSFFQDVEQAPPPTGYYIPTLMSLHHGYQSTILYGQCNCRLRKLPIRPRHLQYIRYLNFSNNWWIKKLPEEISLLYNLLTMDVSDCDSLCRLPNAMKYMKNLRHIYTGGCESLECMPPDLGQLTSLQTLTFFVVGSSSSCSNVSELENINLVGELELTGLENVTEAQAKAASLGSKEKLTHLSLEWNSGGPEELVQDCHAKVLDALKPHGGLEMLRIVNYKGRGAPTWMKELSLFQQHLTELHLVGCTLCTDFPEFSHLRALQILHLIKVDKLQSMCSKMAYVEFPALKKLQLHDLESFESWVATPGKEELSFPVLEEIDIRNCPKLTSLPGPPKGVLTSSAYGGGGQVIQSPINLQVEHGNDLTPTSVSEKPGNNYLPCLDTLFIMGSDKLAMLRNLPPSLKNLSIYHCPELRSISGNLDQLVDVSIGGCNKLDSPDWGNLPALEDFGLLNCKRLTSLPGNLGNYSALRRVLVKYCPAINMKPLYKHLP
uniref:Uncharacterized protein n=1 Tax=Oryza nivara TaxID=4536 RepID=A0A0E0IF24_ORYNI